MSGGRRVLAIALALVAMAMTTDTVRAARVSRIQAQEERLTREAERHFRSYVRQAWPVVHPQGPLAHDWYLDAIADHLQAVTQGQIKDLIINVPPRHLKSTTTCVLWPSWSWGPSNEPGLRWLFTAYAHRLSRRDSVACRRVIQSAWYQERWGHRFFLMGDQNAKDRYETSARGERLIGSFAGGVTGEGADIIVVDDPIDLKNADNSNALERVIEIWDAEVASRLNDKKTGRRVIIMQRVAEHDLCGHVLAQGGWECLRLPAECELEERSRTFITLDGEKTLFFEDPRTKEGELLNPKRFGPAEQDEFRKQGEFHYAAQQQQRPVPRGGTIFQETWWRFYDVLPEGVDGWAQSWDLAFKDLKTSDYVGGWVGGKKGDSIYLTDYLLERLSFTGSCDAIRQWRSKHPKATAILVEDKANGPAVINHLQQEISGLIARNPEGGKVARAFASQPIVQSGHVYLPNPEDPVTGKPIPERAWVRRWIANARTFPKGRHDDDVDAFTQLVIYLRGTHDAVLEFMRQQAEAHKQKLAAAGKSPSGGTA